MASFAGRRRKLGPLVVFGKRVRLWAVVGVLVLALATGGVAEAALTRTVVPPKSTDVFYACRATGGKLRATTMRINKLPARCPSRRDVIVAWTGTGSPGPGATVATEPPGAHCPFGGLKVTDGNGSPTYACDGAPGTSGRDGANGQAGTNGTNGQPGTSGADGQPGTNGTDGQPGTNGTDGQPGTNGIDGVDGIDGIDGVDGIDGTDGSDGQAGVSAVAVAEPVGDNCLTGGVKVTDGLGTVSYICNGAPGPGAPAAARFAWMVEATKAWVVGVETCFIHLGSFTGCASGSNGVPKAATDLLGGEIASITAAGGVITLTPDTGAGISPTDTYILTPTDGAGPNIAHNITWAASGGAIVSGLAQPGYVHPLGAVDNPQVERFNAILPATTFWVNRVEDCWTEIGTLAGCSAGQNGVPASMGAAGDIASITATNGVITLTAGASTGLNGETYVLTPTVGSGSAFIPQRITWTASGTGVTAGLAPFGYVHPAERVEDPRMKRFAYLIQATQLWVNAVEDCYIARGSLFGCDAGQNDVPAAAGQLYDGQITAITTVTGTITLIAGVGNGINGETYILTPTVAGNGLLIPHSLSWTASGSAVDSGLAAGAYVHPTDRIPNARRAAFAWTIRATDLWVTSVERCAIHLGTLAGCSSGENRVPAAITTAIGGVGSLVATNGTITLTPSGLHALPTDTYILTPTVIGSPLSPHNIVWTASGGSYASGLVSGDYLHPTTTIEDPLSDRFATLISATSGYERAIEDCYVATGTLDGCGAGDNGVPANYSGTGSVASVVVSLGGVVTLTPVATGGLLNSDTYVRTPAANPQSGPRLAQDITWSTSGGACNRSLAWC